MFFLLFIFQEKPDKDFSFVRYQCKNDLFFLENKKPKVFKLKSKRETFCFCCTIFAASLVKGRGLFSLRQLLLTWGPPTARPHLPPSAHASSYNQFNAEVKREAAIEDETPSSLSMPFSRLEQKKCGTAMPTESVERRRSEKEECEKKIVTLNA